MRRESRPTFWRGATALRGGSVKRALLAGIGQIQGIRLRLPGLFRQACCGGREFTGRCRSGTCVPMGCREKRPVDAPAGNCGHLAQGLVEMSVGPQLLRRDFFQSALRKRLPLLCGKQSPRRIQRSCRKSAGYGGAVAPGPQRKPDAGDGNARKPPPRLVAVSPGPCMEGSGLLPHGGAEMRMSGLRRLPGRGPQGPVRAGAAGNRWGL